MFEGIWGYENALSGQIRRLERELDELFEGATSLTGTRDIRSLPSGAFPPLNVASTPQAVTVYLFAPGLEARAFDISIQRNLLSVAGERDLPVDEHATYYRRERFSGQFRRTISLPDDADPDRVEAKYADGILTIAVGRRESAKPRQIEVQ
jgi:HSP20 family protein